MRIEEGKLDRSLQGQVLLALFPCTTFDVHKWYHTIKKQNHISHIKALKLANTAPSLFQILLLHLI